MFHLLFCPFFVGSAVFYNKSQLILPKYLDKVERCKKNQQGAGIELLSLSQKGQMTLL